MTVGELRKLLQGVPGDLKVMVYAEDERSTVVEESTNAYREEDDLLPDAFWIEVDTEGCSEHSVRKAAALRKGNRR